MSEGAQIVIKERPRNHHSNRANAFHVFTEAISIHLTHRFF